MTATYLYTGDNNRRKCKHSGDGFSTMSLQKYLGYVVGGVHCWTQHIMCSNTGSVIREDIVGGETWRVRMHSCWWFPRCKLENGHQTSNLFNTEKVHNSSLHIQYTHLIVCSVIHSFIHSFIRSFIHSLIRSFTHSFIHLFVHSLTLSFVHSFIHSLIHSFTLSFVYSFIHFFNHSFIHSLIRSFIHSFIHSFTRSFTHSFIHLFIHSFIQLFIQSSIHSSIHSFIHTFLFKNTFIQNNT